MRGRRKGMRGHALGGSWLRWGLHVERRTPMAVKIDTDLCVACGACVDACPVGALSVEDHAEVNEDECVECGACVDVCPCEALSL